MKKIFFIGLILIIIGTAIAMFIKFVPSKYNYNQSSNEIVVDTENYIDKNVINEITTDSKEEDKEQNTNSAIEDNTYDVTVTEELSPSGFAGSSLYKVILYSNGDIFLESYDGEGYQKENIVSRKLIAKNGLSIKKADNEEQYGMIIIKAKEIIDKNIGWIEFE